MRYKVAFAEWSSKWRYVHTDDEFTARLCAESLIHDRWQVKLYENGKLMKL